MKFCTQGPRASERSASIPIQVFWTLCGYFQLKNRSVAIKCSFLLFCWRGHVRFHWEKGSWRTTGPENLEAPPALADDSFRRMWRRLASPRALPGAVLTGLEKCGLAFPMSWPADICTQLRLVPHDCRPGLAGQRGTYFLF